MEGIVDGSNPRQKRIKVFSEEQRAAINDLQSPNELPHDERKRGYAALQRRLKQPGLPDGCLEQWKAAKTTRQKSFSQIFLCANFRDVYIGLYQCLLVQSIPASYSHTALRTFQGSSS